MIVAEAATCSDHVHDALLLLTPDQANIGLPRKTMTVIVIPGVYCRRCE
jgi:hypothetical protein